MMKLLRLNPLIVVFFLAGIRLEAQQAAPAYISSMNSLHDFDLFANSGWDGNWYVGYNSLWIVELPMPADSSGFVRAYVGAKLGRAKTQTATGQPPWVRSPIDCDLYAGISSTAAWKSSDSYYLAGCEDLPLEGSAEEAMRGSGEARWYWKEVPLSKINFGGKNYLAVWSITPEMTDAASGPILAAGRSGGTVRGWLNRGISGAPPIRTEEALETQLNEFAPALAVKLVPAHRDTQVKVELGGFKEGPDAYLWEIQAIGRNIKEVRPEISVDGNRWVSFGRPAYDPPFQIGVSRKRIQKEVKLLVPGNKKIEQAYIRITAWDEWGNSGSTDNFIVFIKY
ncbi:MAG: hypothetical protein HYT79_10960 [Elusimicrobia bacterium]|nr:hypothetical protein [Elusimicrobiota bacterium]